MLIPTTSGGVLVHISCNKARTKTTATASIDHRHRHLTVSSMAYSMYHLSTECCEHWLSSFSKQINADKNITLLMEVKRISLWMKWCGVYISKHVIRWLYILEWKMETNLGGNWICKLNAVCVVVVAAVLCSCRVRNGSDEVSKNLGCCVFCLCAQMTFLRTIFEVSALWHGMPEKEKDDYCQATARQSQPSKRSKAGGSRQRSRTRVSPF